MHANRKLGVIYMFLVSFSLTSSFTLTVDLKRPRVGIDSFLLASNCHDINPLRQISKMLAAIEV